MSRVDLTICANLKARQVNKEKLSEVLKMFRGSGLKCNVVSIQELTNLSPNNLGEVLVSVGGDGTVNHTASVAIRHSKKLAVVAMGTFNHFAKDLDLPLDPMEAAKKIIKGKTKLLDYGIVNGSIFLNNSVIGFYPHLVDKRENLSGKLGKWLALAVAAIQVLTRVRVHHYQLLVDGKEITVRTPLIVISNNEYELSNVGLADRTNLDHGKLYVYVVGTANLVKMLKASFMLLLGKVSPEAFNRYEAIELEIYTRRSNLRIALDGENKLTKTPLKYQIAPKSLEVVA